MRKNTKKNIHLLADADFELILLPKADVVKANRVL
jgi:hypothetical protein